MQFIRRVLTALSTGYINYFFSETVFWGRFNPETPRWEFIISWIAYSIITYILLTVIDRYHVRSFWALFLAATVYGWTCEGVLAQTLYHNLPFSISLTGLSWHALIVVCWAWYSTRRALAHGSAWSVARTSICLGLFWGAWSVFWWIENKTRTPLEDYIYYATLSGTLLVIAFAFANYVQPAKFAASAVEAWLLFALAAGWFLIIAVAAPIILAILPPLMGIVFLALRKNRRQEARPDVLVDLKMPVPWHRYFILCLVPVTSILFYSLMWVIGSGLPTGWVVYAVTTPVGFILLAISLYKVLTRRETAVVQPAA
jgi:hypothetical protein